MWLAALEHGVRPDDTVLDAPIRLGSYSPQDFDGQFRGEVTVAGALAQSLNTAAVRLLQEAGGPRPVTAVAHRLGIADDLPQDATLALGTGEVGLLELCAAYAALANGGTLVTPRGVDAVEAQGRTTQPPRAPAPRVVDPDLDAMMVQMMTDVVRLGTGRTAALPGRTVAGKTGTTQDSRDAWFVGWVNGPGGPTVVGVWLGNDDGRPMQNVSGGTLPARLFHHIATDARL